MDENKEALEEQFLRELIPHLRKIIEIIPEGLELEASKWINEIKHASNLLSIKLHYKSIQAQLNETQK